MSLASPALAGDFFTASITQEAPKYNQTVYLIVTVFSLKIMFWLN